MNLEKVLAVLVLYKCNLAESETFVSLTNALNNSNLEIDLFVYDNSPSINYQPSDYKNFPGKITYIHDKTNPGISKAYNEALSRAENKNWLLLLDQDTKIDGNYINELNKVLSRKNKYVSIVPVIYSNNNIISPTNYDYLGRMIPINISDANQVINNITAINSASCISVNFLNKIGGFNNSFPLDMLDHWLNYEINKHTKDTYVFASNISHNLSVTDYSSLSIKRYEKILLAEKLFYTKILKKGFLFRIKLLLRFGKLLMNGEISFLSSTLKILL